VVRYEHDGTSTVLADNFGGKKLNSPNDIVAHPDGSYWFTDPPYGGQLYEGEPDVTGGSANPGGKLNPLIGQPVGFVPGKRELPTNCYRIDPSGRLDLVVTEEQVPDPRQHRQRARRYRPGRQGRRHRVRCRHRQQALKPEAVQRLHG
jgi:gluconolactonase